jgi:hypothetical protein
MSHEYTVTAFVSEVNSTATGRYVLEWRLAMYKCTGSRTLLLADGTRQRHSHCNFCTSADHVLWFTPTPSTGLGRNQCMAS